MVKKHVYKWAVWSLCLCLALAGPGQASAQLPWHQKERTLHYRPQGADLVKVSGMHRFNRALYGGNTGFRVEAGDLPEFALYMPGMGGNLQFTLQAGHQAKKLNEADQIETVYCAGSMIYTIRDKLLGKGALTLHVLSLYDNEGILLRYQGNDIPSDVQLRFTYGGASGKRFSRDGDIGADPESSFDLKPEYCTGNKYELSGNTFLLRFALKKETRLLRGVLPEQAALSLATFGEGQPYLDASLPMQGGTARYILVETAAIGSNRAYARLPELFETTEAQRRRLADRIRIHTPDSFINTLGGTLAVAADAIYEHPTYLHGAVAWRMRLNAWRGAYAADPLGWHDRARSHFSSYAKSQVKEPAAGPVVADTTLNMARQLEKMGTSMFSSGYICRNPDGDIRPHHYDMNLVFIDQLLHHFRWTGDTAYVREMWPLLQRHLAWEKRNFDADNDGLYDAYACIWASDALQYNGGAVTHSSAYNYRANKMAAVLARILKENATPYEAEAEKIHNAIRLALWLPHLGSYAEYRDNVGSRNVHPAAGLWTIYHAIDSEVPDAFQAYQALQYVDRALPHIPVIASGIKDTGTLLSTTNWQPYTWSVNNVALAENLHMALAYWQGGAAPNAFSLWRTALMESMLLGISPGNFQQLSFYDAIRGELYRDFADPVGMAARSLVEGLFGIQPDLLRDTLTIKPGFPRSWDHASLQVPDVSFVYKKQQGNDIYEIRPAFGRLLQVQLQLDMPAAVESVRVNGKAAAWHSRPGIGAPVLVIDAGKAQQYEISIRWKKVPLEHLQYDEVAAPGAMVQASGRKLRVEALYDPQQLLVDTLVRANSLRGRVLKREGWGTAFVQVSQDGLRWWEPLNLEVKKTKRPQALIPIAKGIRTIDLAAVYNDRVTGLFAPGKYLSPRWPYPTLQLPAQGIGNWCYPKIMPVLDDSGLRSKVDATGILELGGGLKFRLPGVGNSYNAVFTTHWDNYPDSVIIPLSGKGCYAALMLCGTTNPMQSQLENGKVTIRYTDGTEAVLSLRNPENWWPVEQDYIEDGYAFHLKAAPPQRLHLKTGELYQGFAPEDRYTSLKGFSNRTIEGGAATILYLPLDRHKVLKQLCLGATASEVVVGLMGLSIIETTVDDPQ